MKITIFALHLGFGGVEKYIITLANMLVSKYDVEIISTYKLQDKPAFYLNSKVRVQYLISDFKPNKSALTESIKNRKICWFLKEVWIALRILILKWYCNFKAVKNCESDVIISTRIFHNNLISKYANKTSVKITGEHNHHNNNTRYIKAVVKSCRKFDYFIPISKELYQFYFEEMRKNGVQCLYIRFCVDTNINKSKPNFSNKALITVGRMSREKGIYDLIDVFEKIWNIDKQMTLHIIGDGEEYANVVRKVKEKKIENSIIFHGFKDKKYIYKLLPQCSLYLMTSYTESFGIVLLEAMSCGIPCVAYSSAQGAHEIIEDGENGFLIENRDCRAMCTKIVELINDKKELNRLSDNALKTAEKFSYYNTQMAWLDLMDTIEQEQEKRYD